MAGRVPAIHVFFVGRH